MKSGSAAYTNATVLFPFSLEKDHTKRPNYQALLQSQFLTAAEENVVDMAAFISHVLDDLPDPPPTRKR